MARPRSRRSAARDCSGPPPLPHHHRRTKHGIVRLLPPDAEQARGLRNRAARPDPRDRGRPRPGCAAPGGAAPGRATGSRYHGTSAVDHGRRMAAPPYPSAGRHSAHVPRGAGTAVPAPPANLVLRDGHRPSVLDLRPLREEELHPSLLIPDSTRHFAIITIVGGTYHEVRRIFAALGSHVRSLCRVSFGALELPRDLAFGRWRPIAKETVERPA